MATSGFEGRPPSGPYIVDFACLRHKLIIEADGPFHIDTEDQHRDAWLASEGFRVLRFSNETIATNHKAVIAAILNAVETRGEAGATPCVLGICDPAVAVDRVMTRSTAVAVSP